MTPSRRHLDPQVWHFSIKGCGTSLKSSNLIDKYSDIIILNKVAPSLLELTLRKVYCLSYQNQISYKDEDKYFKRFPRISTSYGKTIMNELPKTLKLILLKGPKTFCCHCLLPIFQESFMENVRAPFSYQNEMDVSTIFYFCSQICDPFDC